MINVFKNPAILIIIAIFILAVVSRAVFNAPYWLAILIAVVGMLLLFLIMIFGSKSNE